MKVQARPGFDTFAEGPWNALVARAAAPSVFLTWQWQIAWARAFAAECPLRVLAVHEDGGDLVGLLPLFEDAPGVWAPIGGADVSDYLDLIAPAGREREVWAALLDWRRSRPETWALRGLRPDSATLAVLPELAAAHGLAATTAVEERCPVLPLPESWEAYLAGLTGKDRHELRRKMRKLENELPGVKARSVAEPDEWDAALDEFLQLHRISRVGKARFMDERMERFFRGVFEELVRLGWVRLWLLEWQSQPVAAFICLEFGGMVGLYNSGFDPTHAKVAPGIVLLAHVIRDAIERKIPLFDFLRGEEPYKYSFGPVPRELFALRLTTVTTGSPSTPPSPPSPPRGEGGELGASDAGAARRTGHPTW